MVQVSNVDDLPALDLYPEPSLGYYRTGEGKTPEVLTVTFADDKSMDTTGTEQPESPPAQPAYFVQKKKKRPLSVSLHVSLIPRDRDSFIADLLLCTVNVVIFTWG